MTTHLAFMLHMHQPVYVEPASGTALLPWVRLHAARAYLDVGALLEEYPEVRMTVNFVPSLVEQLEAVAAGARDTWVDLALRPSSSWTAAERLFLIERFFSVQWSHGIEPRSRYLELLEKRGRTMPREPRQAAAVAAAFTERELRDLTVLFHLAWLGFAARRGAPEIAELEARGRDYEDQDLALVLSVAQAAGRRVLPTYRRLAERGQIELSATPFFHPIVPLLCDSDVARRAQPTLPLPDRYVFPGDAQRQIADAVQAHARAFGAAPAGMWPSEGSISPEAVTAFRTEGVRWLASDEGNLFRSLSPGAPRGTLYQPFHSDGVDLVFRDREISDRIGFTYARGDAGSGVADLLGRVAAAGRLGRDAGIAAPLVAVILDGENPWEQYPGSGEPFLRKLFEELSRPVAAQPIRTATIGGFLGANEGRSPLPRVHSGSWIDSDFHIWIGDPVKNRAWNLLGRARRRFQAVLDEGESAAGANLAAARRHLDAACGSDWFWWFGEPFHSAEDALFDRLFRAHLIAAWRALGELPPEELDAPVSIIASSAAVVPPRARIRPGIDGRISTYYEWVGAGRLEIPRGAAMAETPPIERVHFGFDGEHLFLRCDPDAGFTARLRAATAELTVRSIDRVLRFLAAPGAKALRAVAGGAAVGRIACVEALELALPFAELAAAPGDRLEVVLRVLEPGAAGGEVVLARLPREGYLEVRVPDESFDADHWFV